MDRVWIVESRRFESFSQKRLNAWFARLYSQHPTRLSGQTNLALKSVCGKLPARLRLVALVIAVSVKEFLGRWCSAVRALCLSRGPAGDIVIMLNPKDRGRCRYQVFGAHG